MGGSGKRGEEEVTSIKTINTGQQEIVISTKICA